MNVAAILGEHARDRPEHPAVESGERIVTYQALDRMVTETAANLQAAGVGVGDVVAVMLPDSIDHLVVLYALARAGAVIFPIDISLSPKDRAATLAVVSVKAIVATKPATKAGDPAVLPIADLRRRPSRPFEAPEIGDDDPVAVIQSSGTTGAPKTFIRSHAQKREWLRRNVPGHGWTADERCLSLLQMSSTTGRNTCLAVLQAGATLVIDRSRSLDELVASVRERRVTFLKLTPGHLRQLLDYAADKTPLFPDLHGMAMGSARITQAHRLLARRRLNSNFIELYGCNEAGILTVATPADQDAYPEAVGRLAAGIEAEIVGDDGAPLPAGEVGQVRFRGPGLATGYLNNPEASARAFRDGWFYPGDLAALNEAGYLFLKGRADDVINNSGVKFYPIEVENALLEHPKVTDAAVFGWPHRKVGEVAVAAVTVTTALTFRELRAFCAQRIAAYKVPWRIMFMDELPKNALGKVQKVELVNGFRQRLEKARRRRG
jgi:acyl-CoA synthetase (AMP-forming)/AMP-acid ligase II